jgi:DNA-binding PadR family transcriptional regulator
MHVVSAKKPTTRSHGYEIMKELREAFGITANPGSVYRTLGGLETDSLIRSH